jgi:hypothetical protein
MTHDVETESGLNFCPTLMDINDSFGIKASFHVIPEQRYRVSEGFLACIRDRGYEANVQDLNHDGQLYRDRDEFLRRAEKINRYAAKYGALGFRSGALYRRLDWYDALNFSYDMSVPNVAHLDPQRGGCCTVMPYFVLGILELPLTTTQDYTLFHLLGDYSTALWKRQIDLIREEHGLITFIIHPDYIRRQQPLRVYMALMEHLSLLRSNDRIWMALPRDVDRWWRDRSRMKLVNRHGEWTIDGAGKERAKVAHAILSGDEIVYDLSPDAHKSGPP